MKAEQGQRPSMSVEEFPGARMHASLWAMVSTPHATAVPAAASDAPPREICIATPDIVGPTRNGGIGTACAAIARIWAAAGHRVTILYVRGEFTEGEAIEASVARYAAEGIALVPCPPAPHHLTMPAPLQPAYDTFYWLRDRYFDLIYFPEWTGCGHYTLAARRLGVCFQDTGIIVGTHSPTLWHLEGNRRLHVNLDPLWADALERGAVAAADAVVSPSRYMLKWLGGAGWSLPEVCHVLPNPMPAHTRIAPARSAAPPIRELVFFGRLEARKGLLLFLAALRRLEPDLLARLSVTFLGKPGDAAGDSLRAIAAARPTQVAGWQMLTDLDAAGAGRYVSGEGRLAVIPSLVENSPMTVLECLGLGIPFLAAEVGGIPELLCADDRARHLFSPTPTALARAISQAVVVGLGPARLAAELETEAVDGAWRDVVATYAALPAPRKATEERTPRVSVVLVTRNRPQTLLQAIEGLRAQTWQNLEVVLVDDGSDQPEAIAALDALEADFASREWKMLRQGNRYLGAARNAGWRLASGDFVLFHDDDNISLPQLVATLMRAAERSGADIVTAAMAVFEGDAPPEGGITAAAEIFAPVGGVFAAGLFGNLYGDAHALFRRGSLERLGGFTEDFGVGHEDWELFARATLSGMVVAAVPEPLFWYRISPDSMLRLRRDPDADFMRSGRPFLDLLPPQLRPVLAYAMGRANATASVTPAPDGTLSQFVQGCIAFSARPVIGLPLRVGWWAARPMLRLLLGTARRGRQR